MVSLLVLGHLSIIFLMILLRKYISLTWKVMQEKLFFLCDT